jgi:ribosomal protein L11 methyltransferase
VARTNWPALEIHFPRALDAAGDSLALVQAVLDDFSPTALDDPAAGSLGVRAYFADARQRDRAADAVRAELAGIGITVTAVSVPDDGWAERSQASLTPVQVGRLIVTPPWHALPQPRDVLSVTINPSMGFGTGHHETTRLCLAALQDIDLRGRTVLDVGTGSGVLAIASIVLGAASAVGIDADPDAVRAARENAALNALTDRVDIREADFRLPGFSETADVAVANLTGPTLAASADRLVACAATGGTLILSGFTVSERDPVLAAFASTTSVARESAEGDWAAAVLDVAPGARR